MRCGLVRASISCDAGCLRFSFPLYRVKRPIVGPLPTRLRGMASGHRSTTPRGTKPLCVILSLNTTGFVMHLRHASVLPLKDGRATPNKNVLDAARAIQKEYGFYSGTELNCSRAWSIVVPVAPRYRLQTLTRTLPSFTSEFSMTADRCIQWLCPHPIFQSRRNCGRRSHNASCCAPPCTVYYMQAFDYDSDSSQRCLYAGT